jgi:HAD superfamily hydrolase (TIGR01509 family)
MSVRALLLDFNGILVDDEPVHCELLREVLIAEGIPLSVEEYYDRYLGYDDRGVLTRAFEAAGRTLSPEHGDRLVARKADIYLRRMTRDGFPFFPGAEETLRWALDRYAVAVVSGALRQEIEGALDQVRLRPRLAAIIAAEDAISKPSPDGYLLGLAALRDRLGATLATQHILAVEDSPAGIRAARGAGLPVVGVSQTYGPESLAEAHYVVARVDELPALLEGLHSPRV